MLSPSLASFTKVHSGTDLSASVVCASVRQAISTYSAEYTPHGKSCLNMTVGLASTLHCSASRSKYSACDTEARASKEVTKADLPI